MIKDCKWETTLYKKYSGIEYMNNCDKKKLYKLRDSISLDPKDIPGENNDYSYALGLTVPKSEILPASYIPGIIGAAIKGISIDKLLSMKDEERLFLDLEALDIEYSKCSVFCDSPSEVINGYLKWVIAMYEKIYRYHDLHFLRREKDGRWSHKIGIFREPFRTNCEGEPITDISDNNFQLEEELFIDYDFLGSYELKLRR